MRSKCSRGSILEKKRKGHLCQENQKNSGSILLQPSILGCTKSLRNKRSGRGSKWNRKRGHLKRKYQESSITHSIWRKLFLWKLMRRKNWNWRGWIQGSLREESQNQRPSRWATTIYTRLKVWQDMTWKTKNKLTQPNSNLENKNLQSQNSNQTHRWATTATTKPLSKLMTKK